MNTRIFSKILESLKSISEKVLLIKHGKIKNYRTSFHFLNIALFLLFIGVSLTILNSCNKNATKKDTPTEVIIYPPPPDQARFQFLTKISSSDDLGKKQGAFSKLVLGAQKPSKMVKPYGIAIYKGKIYVCDNYTGGLEVIDLEKKRFDYFRPTGRGQLRLPINCYVDEKGYLYVADAGRLEIVVFDANGNFVRSFGDKVDKFKPSDVCVYDNKVFVANILNGKINVFANDSTNKLLYTFPNQNDSTNNLCSPSNIAVSMGRVYASDFGCSMIRIFSTDGTFISNVGSLGDLPGQFTKIKGIAVDSEANVFAVDALFDNLQIFNKEGKLLMPLSGHYNGPGGLVSPAKVIIDYDNLKYFQKYVDPAFDLKYLVIVTSQYGPDPINIYGRVEPKTKPTK